MAVLLCLAPLLLSPRRAHAQENYFVTYTHHMEEPGNLEFATKSVSGFPEAGNAFWGNAIEMEYGVKTWWTSELYLDSRPRPMRAACLPASAWRTASVRFCRSTGSILCSMPSLRTSTARTKRCWKSWGMTAVADFLGSNDRSEKKREAELKLILSSNFKGWNVAENMIAEKNIAGEPWEFGYAVAVSRPLSLAASPKACRFCRENFALGAELYGGLGDRYSFGLHDTSHYLAPTMAFHLPNGPTFSVSPAAGLNSNSHGFLLRFGVAYEINQFFSRLRGK